MNNTTQTTNNTQVVNVIWTDPSTQITCQAEVGFDTKLDFNRMDNIILSF